MHKKMSTGARVLYLSLNQAAPYIKKPEAAYGGAPRHWLIAMLNFNLVLRMMGRAKAKPYEIVETKSRMKAKA